MKTKYSLFDSHKKMKTFTVIAGPCAIENIEQMNQVAKTLVQENISLMRGGIYKMRTRPESFQGLREKAIDIIRSIKKNYNIQLVSEISDPRQLPHMLEIVDIFQVGARNMYNYELLKELGLIKKPILLKRSFSALIKEWLSAAEYLIKGGNEQVILCERGIRTFETSTRNTIDLTGALIAQKESALPVIVDPSHGTGHAEYVTPLALAAVACGLDGLLVEIHPAPKTALSDVDQSLDLEQFQEMIKKIKILCSALHRTTNFD